MVPVQKLNKSLVLIVFIGNGSLVLPDRCVKSAWRVDVKKINYNNFVHPVCKFQIFRIKLERLRQNCVSLQANIRQNGKCWNFFSSVILPNLRCVGVMPE